MPERVRLNTPDEEAVIQRGIARDPDAQEADADWFARARPAAEALPPDVYDLLVRRRGPGRKPAKVSVTLRLPPDIAEALRATGPGWQVRAGEALAALAKRGPGK